MAAESPEEFYFKEGSNGYSYYNNDIKIVAKKIVQLCSNKKLYESFALSAKQTINLEGSVDKMFDGFLKAIQYTTAHNIK